jgi:5'-nucleotidase
MKVRVHSNLIPLQGLGVLFFILFFVSASAQTKLVILHTNDTHSQVEPTEKSGTKTSDMGGYARRMGVINQIRKEEKNVLLLDAGDFSQGTPYYNFYNGRIEIEAMNRMKYDAGTLGNHEFDNGIDTLAAILRNAKFPIVCSNYKLANTPLATLTTPYLILKKFGLKIGIMGLCIDPKGLIIDNNYVGVEYVDAVETAQNISEFLKKKEKCDVIICLSHLGADSAKSNVTDYHVARSTKYIDVIIGGHSHEIIENTQVKNADGKNIVIAQMGKSGFYLGKVELELKNKK